MNGCDIPRLDQVGAVYLAVTCESLIDDDSWQLGDEDGKAEAETIALGDLARYFGPLAAVRQGWAVDLDYDHIHRSESGLPYRCYTWQVGGYLTPEEWADVAAGYLLELGDLALPEDHSQTMGIITEDGLIPAVAINGTDEGWNYGYHEPRLIASFYVALAVKE